MKKVIKIFALALSLTLISAIVIGCVAGEDEKKTIKSSDSQDVSSDDGSNNAKTDGKKDNSSSKPTEIEETVLLERDGLKITAKEYITDTFWGDGIKLLFENTSDENLTVGCDALMVNDYMVSDLFFSCDVAAGKKANDTIYLSSSDLKNAGIDNIGKIEIDFYAHDDDYDRVFENEMVMLKTNKFDEIDTESIVEGVELYNANGVKIVGQYVNENTIWGTSVLIYVENNTDKEITVSCDDLSVNGFMVTEYFYSNVYAGKKAVDSITLSEADLEENDIDSVEDIEVSFTIRNSKTYATIEKTSPIKFSVN